MADNRVWPMLHIMQDSIRKNISPSFSPPSNVNGWMDIVPLMQNQFMMTVLPQPPFDLVSSICVYNDHENMTLTVALLANGMQLAKIKVPPREMRFRDFAHAPISYPSYFFRLSIQASHKPAICLLRYQNVSMEQYSRLSKENTAVYIEDHQAMALITGGMMAMLTRTSHPPTTLTEVIQNVPEYLLETPPSICDFFQWVKLDEHLKRPGEYHYPPTKSPHHHHWVTSLIVVNPPANGGEIRMVDQTGKPMLHAYRLVAAAAPFACFELALEDVCVVTYAKSFVGPPNLDLWVRAGRRDYAPGIDFRLLTCTSTLVTPDFYVYYLGSFQAILRKDALATETFVGGLRSGPKCSIYRAFREHVLAETRLLTIIVEFLL